MSLSLGLSPFNPYASTSISGPTNTVVPSISGTAEIGSTLTCSTGTWTGTGAITYAYQWTRDGADIASATSSTYTVQAADGGATVACRVTATDDNGSVSATAAGVAIPAGSAPSAFTATMVEPTGPAGTSMGFAVKSLPSGTITDIEVRANGGSAISLSASTTGVHRATGLTEDTGYSWEIRALNGTSTSAWTSIGWKATTPLLETVDAAPSWLTTSLRPAGYDPTEDFGTVGDWYMDPVLGDDTTGAGTEASPYQTPTKIEAVATAGDTVKVRAGDMAPFTPTVSLIWEPYGKERPRITSFDLLSNAGTGPTLCTSPTDDSVLGSSLAGSGNVYKYTGATIPAAYSSRADALNLHEAGKRLHHSMDWAGYTAWAASTAYEMHDLRENGGDAYMATQKHTSGADFATDLAANKWVKLDKYFARSNEQLFHLADSFTLNGSNQITAIVDADVIGGGNWTDADLTGRSVAVYKSPNEVYYATVTSSDVASDTIQIDGLFTVNHGASHTADDYRYAILGAAFTMDAGTFLVRNISAGTCDVYVYPTDANNIDTIEYATDDFALELGSAADSTEIRGFEICGSASDTTNFGQVVRRITTASELSGLVLEKNLIHGQENLDDICGTVELQDIGSAVIRQNTVYDCIDSTGIFIRSPGGATPTALNLVDRNHLVKVGRSPYVMYDQQNAGITYNLAELSGLSSHADQLAFYRSSIGGDGVAFWGNRHYHVNGFVTWQGAGYPVIMYNFIQQQNKQNAKTIYDQSNAGAPYVAGTKGFIGRNTQPPENDTNVGDSVFLAASLSDIQYYVFGNVLDAVNAPADWSALTSTIELMSGNVHTKLYSTTMASFDTSNVDGTTRANVYTDVFSGDYSPAASSPILTTKSPDPRDLQGFDALTEWQGRFTQVDFTYDAYGNTIDWNVQHVGCDAGLSFALADTTPSVTGVSATVTGDTTADIDWSTDADNGIAYIGMWPTASTPTDAEIIAGTGAAFHTTYTFDPITDVGATGAQAAISATGLTAGTAYKPHVLHRNNVNENGSAVGSEVTTTGGGYSINAVAFDGTNYLSASTFSATGSKQALVAFSLFSPSSWPASASRIIQMQNSGGSGVVDIEYTNAGRLNIRFRNSAGTTIAQSVSASSTFVADTWYTILIGIDTATSTVQVYKWDGSLWTEISNSPTVTADAIIDNAATSGIGATAGGIGLMPATYLADVFCTIGETLDLSVLANREKFLPTADKGADGSTPTGTQPPLFLSGATANWNTNKGTGGGFTVNGSALTTAPSTPS